MSSAERPNAASPPPESEGSGPRPGGGRGRRLLDVASRPDRLKRLRRKIAIEHPLDLNRRFDSLIFVAGTGRSGTTWLVDLLNADNRHRVIFEPLRPRWGALGDRNLPRYIRPDVDDPELVGLVRNVLLGKLESNRWVGGATSESSREAGSSRTCTATCDSPGSAASSRFFPIILIIRHPCAVAASRRRLGDEALDLAAALPPRGPPARDDHLRPFLPELQRIETPFEREIAAGASRPTFPSASSRAVGHRRRLVRASGRAAQGNPRPPLRDAQPAAAAPGRRKADAALSDLLSPRGAAAVREAGGLRVADAADGR